MREDAITTAKHLVLLKWCFYAAPIVGGVAGYAVASALGVRGPMRAGVLGVLIGFASFVAFVFPPILRVRSLRRREPPIQPPEFWMKHYDAIMSGACILSVVVAGAAGGLVGLWLSRPAS